jgi:hypothetical protein
MCFVVPQFNNTKKQILIFRLEHDHCMDVMGICRKLFLCALLILLVISNMFELAIELCKTIFLSLYTISEIFLFQLP